MVPAEQNAPMRYSGFLNIDKPAGMTSRSVVDRVVQIVGIKRVGHAGTLDPLATGTLVVAIGRASRLVEYVQQMPKTYVATFRLGQTSDTDDREGAIVEHAIDAVPDRRQVESALQRFVGQIDQLPPRFSALKIAGRRAHQLARRGLPVELKPRTVTIHSIELLEYRFPDVRLRVECGSGTYIRSLARDLGASLDTGGLMSELRRTAIGEFLAENALALENLSAETWIRHGLPLAAAVSQLPGITLPAEAQRRFDLGQPIRWDGERPSSGEVAVFTSDRKLVGIGRFDTANGMIRPAKGGFLRADEGPAP